MKITEFSLFTCQNHSLREIGTRNSTVVMASRILAEITKFRRVADPANSCADLNCSMCSSFFLPKIISAVESNKPVTFVLPAFPGKSPNSEKVFGPLPDYAEQLSLEFLGRLCQRVKSYCSHGIRIILCSDGRVFSDVVGMKENNVTAYQDELDRLIEEMSLSDITTFNLDDAYGNLSFGQMRDELMNTFGNSLDFLKEKIRNGANSFANAEEQEANRMYRGITRFLFEDSLFPGQAKSRTAIQNESRSKAYEVIRRSNAWSALIAEHFPEAVRLSIHPQTCGSKKLGIRLIGNETWMTPWHGVAVETKDGYVLLKRSEAEAMNAELVYSSTGTPSHYKLTSIQDLPAEMASYGI